MNFSTIKLLDFLSQKLFVIYSHPNHPLSLFVEVYIRLAPCPAPHHLEAEATLSNNPRKNYISFHTKDVFDLVKLDSNSHSSPIKTGFE